MVEILSNQNVLASKLMEQKQLDHCKNDTVYLCFQGHQDTERVDLNLTCNDLSFIPGYSTSTEELTANIPAAGAITDRKSNVLEGMNILWRLINSKNL